jgi:hypothetical protein
MTDTTWDGEPLYEGTLADALADGSVVAVVTNRRPQRLGDKPVVVTAELAQFFKRAVLCEVWDRYIQRRSSVPATAAVEDWTYATLVGPVCVGVTEDPNAFVLFRIAPTELD